MNYRTHTTITIMVLILLGCHILQKDKQTLKQLRKKEQLQIVEQRNIHNYQTQLMLIDSSHNEFTLQLWPKGRFTFSVAKGFEGEAEKIVINGKHTNQKLLAVKQETKRDSTLLKTNYYNTKENNTIVKKNKLNFGNNWTWMLVIPGFYILYLLYKRYG